MRISFNQNLNFQRRLRSDEEADFSRVLKQGKEALGNTGHSILIVPSSSLPQSANTNTGVGNLLDSEATKFVDFAKQYWGINTVQLIPDGTYKKFGKDSYKPYSGSALDLGNQSINLEMLTKTEFAEILSVEDLKKVVESNKNSTDKVNFENVLDKDSETEKALIKAFENLKKNDTTPKRDLLKDFENYRTFHKSWLEPKAIYKSLEQKYGHSDCHLWNTFDKNFYNEDVVSINERQNAINGLRSSEYGKAGEFFEFKQYLADKQLAMAKNKLHQKGVKLCGDVLIGFSGDEIWANPKAFIEHGSIGWGIPAVNYDSDEGIKLLRKKIELNARRYDSLRIDASWSYVSQPVERKLYNEYYKKEYGSKLLDIIDDEIKKVKGANYDLKNVMHEFIANPKDFTLYEEGGLKPYVKNRVKTYTTHNLSWDWATTKAFKNKGWDVDSYVLGVTNHDSFPLRLEFNNIQKRTFQTDVLSTLLNIPKNILNTFQGFLQAKYAEPMRAKHNMFFFTDALNILDRYKDNINEADDYRIKIPESYQDNFFKSLEKGEGFNVMDALEKAFVAEGLDKKNSELFEKIVNYRKILQSKESPIIDPPNSKWKLAKTIIFYAGAVGLSAIASYYFLLNKNGSSKQTPNVE